ncbi:MAG TPA: hypothetical protein VF708_17475 [Pyrinomonadaceae bacterium]|jgi:hypothetical protein
MRNIIREALAAPGDHGLLYAGMKGLRITAACGRLAFGGVNLREEAYTK